MGNQLTFEMEVGLHPFGLSAAEDAVNSGLAAHRIATTRLPKVVPALRKHRAWLGSSP